MDRFRCSDVGECDAGGDVDADRGRGGVAVEPGMGEIPGGGARSERARRADAAFMVTSLSLGWTAALAACILALGARDAVAQTRASPPSTLNGVYTAEQAVRGRDLYAGMCQSCHTAASHTGVRSEERRV